MAMNRDMMAKIAQMGQQLQKAQADLAEKRVEGTAGGGAVTVVLTGGMKVESLKIDKEVIDPDDVSRMNPPFARSSDVTATPSRTGASKLAA